MSLILSRVDINDIPGKLKSVKKVRLGGDLHFIHSYTLCLNEEKVIHIGVPKKALVKLGKYK